MMNTVVASLVLFGASTAASAVGSAHVVNKCNYPVTLCNVPASGGGYEQQDKVLSAGESWEQTWTELSNGNGWSIKLSKTENLDHILQYEYTFHNDGTIWYDLSCVDGNPWDQDWEITANGTSCNPKQQAYRYSTDDAYGMQSCPQDAAITVTLCTGVSADNGSSVDASSSAPSYASASASQSAPSYDDATASSASSSSSAPAATAYGYNFNNADASASAAGYGAKVTPTTLATHTTAATVNDAYGVTITEIETAYVTAEVTAYANRFRRHDHHAHAHAHEHEHHA